MKKGIYLFSIMFMIFLFLVLSGCSKQKDAVEPDSIYGIKTGQSQELLSATIGEEGGKINLSQDSNIKGMEIEISENSFSQDTNFTVAVADIQEHQLGILFNPVTPMVTVDNGKVFSDNTMFVTIPVKKTDNEILIGLFYNPETQSLEGIPSVYQNPNKITLATKHFSSFLVSSATKDNIDKAGDATTDFQPGKDDFIFANHGSHVAPRGHCAGQSLGMIWYYKHIKLKGGEDLFGLLDNNGDEATPNFQEDDALLYRFASSIQVDSSKNFIQFFEEYCEKAAEAETTLTTFSQKELQFYAMKYVMLMTNRPQVMGMFGIKNDGKKAGHAVVVYKIVGDKIYIADPNYPGKEDRFITFDGSNFSSYHSGEDATSIASGDGIAYNEFYWVGEFAICNENKITERWQEVERKDMGNDLFPYAEIEIEGGVNQVQKSLDFSVTVPLKIGELHGVSLYTNYNQRIDCSFVFRGVGDIINSSYFQEDILEEGKNILGFYIYDANNEWYSFQRITINVDTTFKLVSDKDSYKKGETATISIVMPSGTETKGMEFFLGSEGSKVLFTGQEFKYQIPNNAKETIRISCRDPLSGNVRSIDLVVTGVGEQEDLEFVSNKSMEYYLDKSNRIQGEFRTYYDEAHQILESLRFYEDNVEQGNFTMYFENGVIKEEGKYISGKKDGLIKIYYDSGQVISEKNYVKGIKDGPSRTWSKNGNISSEGMYVNGMVQGEFRNYYDTGELWRVENYIDGKIKGTSTEYNKDGTIKKTTVYN